MHDIFNSPALTLSIALAAGMTALALGAVLRVPGILLALGAGVLLGPSGPLKVVRPETLGPWLQIVVGFCVSVILFEGALSLNPRRLKRTGTPVRRLISIGALIAAGGAALVAYYFMHWRIEIAALFGALLIVTGPTVISPLLRRIKAEKTVATVLAAEGVLGDAVGAILATVVFGIALHPVASSFGLAALELGKIALVGGLVGGSIGLLIVGVARWKALAQHHMNRIATLALVLLAFQLANALAHESGVLAAVVAGLVAGFMGGEQEELIEFKEELSMLFIGLLFVILAANVDLVELQGLALPALAVAGCLVFLVRPAAVMLSTIGSGLSVRQRLFISWIGPRGIVAAAVASLFATQLADTGAPEGTQFRAVVFVCIVTTVTLSGLTGKPVGKLFKVLAKSNQGWLIFGANSVARALGKALKDAGEEVLLVDRNREEVAHAEMAGLPVMQANALEVNTLLRGGVETRKGVIAMTANDEINLLFVQAAKRLAPHVQAWLALGGGKGGVTDHMVEAAGARTVCGRKFDVALLAAMLEEGRLEVQSRKREEAEKDDEGKTVIRRAGEMPLLVRKGKSIEPASGSWKGVTEVVMLSPKPKNKPEEQPEPAAT